MQIKSWVGWKEYRFRDGSVWLSTDPLPPAQAGDLGQVPQQEHKHCPHPYTQGFGPVGLYDLFC